MATTAAKLANGMSVSDAPPRISPVQPGDRRPKVSVVIPTYEPERFLLDTIRCVLAQDLGAAQMQIAVIDDGSKRTDVRSLLAGLSTEGRIEIYQHQETLGLAGNWNRAIAYARGEFVHLLHQDDTINHGFYAALLSGMDRSERIGMAFCRHAFIDENDKVERVSHRERWRPGVLRNWLDRISERQRLQCPAAIVRREAYEKLGGFRPDLRYALDWEMWVRIAAAHEVWYEPRVLANYRRHRGTETTRLRATDQTTADTMCAIDVISSHLPAARRSRLQQRAYSRLVHLQAKSATRQLEAGSSQLPVDQLQNAQIAMARLPDSFAKRLLRLRLARLERRIANRTSQVGA
jgi:glycosyltransferase involved in cell wall biosynthesis